MSRSAIAAIVIAVIVLLGGGVLLATHNSSNNTNTGTTTTPMGMNQEMHGATNGGTGSTQTATSTVTIENFAFNPANISVKKGTTVTWVNKDSTAHTVTEIEGNGPESGMLAPGHSYSFTFNAVGTFNYHCTIHPNMTGTVTVTS